jgi:ABC-type antimicrobial peptide transport system permease subunit
MKDVGFDEEQIVSLTIPDNFPFSKISVLKEKLKMNTSIVNAAGSDRNFIRGASDNTIKTVDGNVIRTRFLRIDSDYLETLGIELLQGRNFSESFGSDQDHAVLVNETLVREFGWKHPIGMTFPEPPCDNLNPAIIGVVKDFHFDSMRRKIQPLIMTIHTDANRIGTVFVRIRPERIPQTMAFIQKTWREVASGLPMQHTFLDENLNNQYKAEEQWNKITGLSALFAIMLSSSGLLGLTILAMRQRIKEIGIRKVIGATMTDILLLLSQNIVRFYILANLIAWPIAYFAMNQWLQNFAYRTDMGWWVFVLAGALALVIALLTVSWQAIHAATANPVDALRYE